METDLDSLAPPDGLRAAAEPLRWRTLTLLAREELCVCHLVEALDAPQSLVSHHLRALRAAGPVESERFRYWTYYRLRPGLMALILAFGKASGAHFNPVVTLADRWLGGVDTGRAVAYIGAQVAGGCIGAMVANLMFDLPAVEWSTHTRSSGGLWLGEIVAT